MADIMSSERNSIEEIAHDQVTYIHLNASDGLLLKICLFDIMQFILKLKMLS